MTAWADPEDDDGAFEPDEEDPDEPVLEPAELELPLEEPEPAGVEGVTELVDAPAVPCSVVSWAATPMRAAVVPMAAAASQVVARRTERTARSRPAATCRRSFDDASHRFAEVMCPW